MKSHPTARAPQSHNRLLAALPAAEWRRLRLDLEPVELSARENLLPSGEVFAHAYFIEAGMVSLVRDLTEGTAVEVALIGREGFVGVPIVLGVRESAAHAIVQLKGSALRITATALIEAAQRNKKLHSLLLCYAHALQVQMMQIAACNHRHDLPRRLARWLLSARDRYDRDELPLSHESLSATVGRRRSGVTEALGEMKKAGLVANLHGRVRIVDRRGLEHVACECYQQVRDEYSRLLP